MITTKISILTEAEIPDFLSAAELERGQAEWTRMAGLAQDMLKNERTIWVARQDDLYVGMVSVRWQSDYSGFRTAPAAAEIVDLYVWQAKRRQGIGALLMDHAEDTLRERGYKRAGLGVGILQDDMDAWPLYRQRDYQFDSTGAWWNGQKVTDQQQIDQTIAPILLMMEKKL